MIWNHERKKNELESIAQHKKNIAHNKSPGSDALPADFVKIFCKNLGYFVIRSLNYEYKNGEISSIQKHEIFTCLLRKGKVNLI